MPSQESLEIIIEIHRRPFWKIALRFPSAMKAHYKIFRKHLPVLKSLYGAWLMAGLSLRFPK